ncbi:hypothetical protein WAI453_009908 [Rhynchosporium graminicola]
MPNITHLCESEPECRTFQRAFRALWLVLEVPNFDSQHMMSWRLPSQLKLNQLIEYFRAGQLRGHSTE